MRKQIRFHLWQAALLLLTFSSPVNAEQAAVEKATFKPASVVLPSAGRATLRWTGRGNVRDGVAVCVSSPTGRYEIAIQSLSGQGLSGEMFLPYTVGFEAAGAASSGVLSTANPIVRFSGQVDPARTCDSGPNARLIVSLATEQALAGVAGTYNDQIVVSIEPR